MRFYLGAPSPAWLATAGVPLFVSRTRLARRKALPRAAAPWALDSGGFSELSAHGRWTIEPERYVDEVRRYRDEIGQLEWAAAQDWMCEPDIRARTGKSVEDHQELTVANYLRLLELAPDLRDVVAPVLQGWSIWDYHRHVARYAAAGVDLSAAPIVGVGTVCRRQATTTGYLVLSMLASATGLRLHGFGFKQAGLVAPVVRYDASGVGHGTCRIADLLASADSQAWSFQARRAQKPMLPSCKHANCNTCLPWALRWREKLLALLAAPVEPLGTAAPAPRELSLFA